MEICVWICNQIKDYCSVKETVKMQNDTFRLDISGFLREMGMFDLEVFHSSELEIRSIFVNTLN